MTRLITACVLAGIVGVLGLAPRQGAAAEASIGELRDRIVETERKKLELVKTLALIFETRGDQEKALAYSREAFMLDPSNETLARKLLGLLRQDERWSEMIPIYERLVDERPGQSQQYLLELGTCHFKVGQAERALEVLEQYRKEYADNEDTYLSLARLLSDNGRLAEAATLLEEAVADRFKDHYKLHWQLGIVYVNLAETEKAIEAYEAALDLVEPGFDRREINNHLIALYKQAEQINELIKKREREIEDIDSRLVEFYWAEATEHEEAGRLQEALFVYGKIVALSPESDKGKAAAAKVDELRSKLEN